MVNRNGLLKGYLDSFCCEPVVRKQGLSLHEDGEFEVCLGSNMNPNLWRLSSWDIPVWIRVLLSSRTFFPWRRIPTCSSFPSIVVTASITVLYKIIAITTRRRINNDHKSRQSEHEKRYNGSLTIVIILALYFLNLFWYGDMRTYYEGGLVLGLRLRLCIKFVHVSQFVLYFIALL